MLRHIKHNVFLEVHHYKIAQIILLGKSMTKQLDKGDCYVTNY